MAGDEHRPPVGRLLAHQPAHPADAGRVQAVGGLVEDQDLGVAEQGGGDGQALAHAHGVALHAPVGGVLEPDGRQDLVDAARRVLPGGGQHTQVVAPAAAGMEGGVPEHGADLGAGPVS